MLGVNGDNYRYGLLGAPRISARVKVPGRENRGRFVVEDCLPEIWEEFLLILGEETDREGVDGQLYRHRGEDKLCPGVFANWKRLVEGPGEGLEVGGVGRGRSSLVGDGEGDGSS